MLEQAPSFSVASPTEMADGRWIVAEMERPFGRGINFEIEVADVDAVHRRFEDRGYPLTVPMHQKSYRVGGEDCLVRQFLAADPDGYLVRPSQTLQLATRR
jgi:hypothetical protein